MRVFKFALLLFVGSVLLGGAHNVSGESSTTWSDQPVEVALKGTSTAVSFDKSSCPTFMAPIEIEGVADSTEACIYGANDKLRVARYRSNRGVYAYAGAYPADTKFTIIKDFCTNMQWCVYGQSEDVLLMQSFISSWKSGQVFVKDFSKYLKLYEGSPRYYQFEYDQEYSYLGVDGGRYATGSVGLSPSGRWALVELHTLGFVRIDLRTLEFKRVVAPGAVYGVANDPVFETTITDDGRKIAIVGWRAGLDVIEITDTCGDVLTVDSMSFFSTSTAPCLYASVDRDALFPGFVYAQVPRFSRDTSALSLYVTAGQGIYFARIAPTSHINISTPAYAALGDSFTSGEGEVSDTFYLPETNTTNNKCHVSTRSYPYLLQPSWGVTATNWACSGSRIDDVRKVVGAISKTEPTALPSILSIGVGGNDVDLMGKLKTCLLPGTCEWADPMRRIATANEIKRLFSSLTRFISEIKSENAGTLLFVVGYPEVINETSTAHCNALLGGLLNPAEREYMGESIRYLNKVIREAAYYTGTRYIDIERVFNGDRLCDSTEKAMNGIRLGDDIAPIPFLETTKIIGAESFHPTPYGHTLVAQAIEAQLDSTFWEGGICYTCQYDISALEVPDYWLQNVTAEWSEITQLSVPFIKHTEIFSNQFMNFEFTAGTFAPNQPVTFELHSDVLHLDTITSNEDGSLAGSVFLPQGVSGYHTVHALGKSFSGDSLDIYQTIFIESPIIPRPPALVSSGDPSSPINTGPPTQKTQGGALLVDSPVSSSTFLGSFAPVSDLAQQVPRDENDDFGKEVGGSSVLGLDTLKTGPSDKIENERHNLGIFRTYIFLALVSVGIITTIYILIKHKTRNGSPSS